MGWICLETILARSQRWFRSAVCTAQHCIHALGGLDGSFQERELLLRHNLHVSVESTKKGASDKEVDECRWYNSWTKGAKDPHEHVFETIS